MKMHTCIMRKARFIPPQAEISSATYHCVSRVVDRCFVLGRKEKDVFVRMMREHEDFCGVQVLAYCIMSNHFHILVEDGYAARVMAVYIDLNPIRAGMVKKPEDYKWCSYGARPMRGVGWQKKETKLFSMRQLVKDRLG